MYLYIDKYLQPKIEIRSFLVCPSKLLSSTFDILIQVLSRELSQQLPQQMQS